MNVDPTPTSLFTQIRPSSSSTNFRHGVRPSPVPSTWSAPALAHDAAGGVGALGKANALGGPALRCEEPPPASLKSRTAEDQTRSASDDAVAAALDEDKALTAQARAR